MQLCQTPYTKTDRQSGKKMSYWFLNSIFLQFVPKQKGFSAEIHADMQCESSLKLHCNLRGT